MDQNCTFVHTINVVVVVVVAVIAVVDCALSIPPHSLREEFLAVKVLLPRAVYAVVVCPSVRLSVCLSVCLSQAGIVPKRLDESSWFLARRLSSTCPTLRY